MRRVRWVFAFLLYSFVFHASAGALTGVQSVGILVEDLDEDAIACGITQDLLDSAVRVPLSNTKLPIRRDMLIGPYLYVNVTVLRPSKTTCVAAYQVTLNRRIWLSPTDEFTESGGVWRKGGIYFGGGTDFSRNVANSLESITKQFVGAWLKDN